MLNAVFKFVSQPDFQLAVLAGAPPSAPEAETSSSGAHGWCPPDPGLVAWGQARRALRPSRPPWQPWPARDTTRDLSVFGANAPSQQADQTFSLLVRSRSTEPSPKMSGSPQLWSLPGSEAHPVGWRAGCTLRGWPSFVPPPPFSHGQLWCARQSCLCLRGRSRDCLFCVYETLLRPCHFKIRR